MRVIKVHPDSLCLVDDDDYSGLSQFSWRLSPWGYVVRTVNGVQEDGVRSSGTTIHIHRQILKASLESEIDHINRDKLDNRKANLRFCDKSQNVWNSGPRKTSHTGVKGVGWHKRIKKYHARINTSEGCVHIGYFKTIEEAHAAYTKKVVELRGDYAFVQSL